MIEWIEVSAFMEKIRDFLILDVRSPLEYTQGNLPGAVNIPLFSDSERAVIGTIYHQKGREAAIIKGLDICLPKTSEYLDHLRRIAEKKSVFLYCWRGGFRSKLMAEVFSSSGYKVGVLNGGYKSYRRFVRDGFSNEAPVVVLGGFTGSGKTQLLEYIANQGEQVIDFEKLASHKGSVFGALGQGTQSTNEQFENNLFALWSEMDFSRPIWMEDESRMIGKVTLPDPVFKQLNKGLMISVELPFNKRISRLVQEYSGFDKVQLASAILKLQERLGGLYTKEALLSLESGQFEKVAEILLAHYDKAYQYSMNRKGSEKVYKMTLSADKMDENAVKIINFVNKILSK